MNLIRLSDKNEQMLMLSSVENFKHVIKSFEYNFGKDNLINKMKYVQCIDILNTFDEYFIEFHSSPYVTDTDSEEFSYLSIR